MSHNHRFSVGRDASRVSRYEFVIYGKSERDPLIARQGGFKSWKAAFKAAAEFQPGSML